MEATTAQANELERRIELDALAWAAGSGLLASLRHLCRQSVESSSFQNLFRPGACREAPLLFLFL